MPSLNLVTARLADVTPMPTPAAMYEYVVAGNGLFVRAEDAHIEALIPVAPAVCQGLEPLAPFARLKAPRIHAGFLAAILRSAQRHLPDESAYQFVLEAPLPWRCVCPYQTATPTSVDYQDTPEAVVDLHSHADMAAFWSTTDNADEQGLRFYAVAGCINFPYPQIRARVGVYGHHWDVPITTIFDGRGPFSDTFNKEIDL